jgi:excisionase family DNA binding protein
MGSRLVTTKEAAVYLGLAEVTLRQWRGQGRGPRFVRAGRAIRYREADLDAWAERNAQDPRPVRRIRSA